MTDPHTILGIHITDRLEEAVPVQQALTEFGNTIKTRLGLHEPGDSKNGLVLLEVVAEAEKIQQICDKLNAIDGVEVQTMVFHH
ncbi:MAG: hypothetical protein HN909_05690 [Phycisphaerales bacterium]|jgi:hypothetical protein|nr:hypothetical protein [Phycisphaerales bacterium]MBT7171246.1 hypothetical protein [Phycisphaerales bacterium]